MSQLFPCVSARFLGRNVNAAAKVLDEYPQKYGFKANAAVSLEKLLHGLCLQENPPVFAKANDRPHSF